MKDDWLNEVISACNFEAEERDSQICKWCGGRKWTSIHTAKEAILTHIDQIVREVIGEQEPTLLNYEYEPVHMRNKLRQEQLKRWESMK